VAGGHPGRAGRRLAVQRLKTDEPENPPGDFQLPVSDREFSLEYLTYRAAQWQLENGKSEISLHRLDENRRAVGQHFGDALHHLRRVVTSPDHCISAQLRGVDQHEVESFGARLLA